MAFTGDNVIYSSPIGRGSDGVSRDQSPSTVLTSFSPEEVRVRLEGRDRPLTQLKAPVSSNGENSGTSDGDPFKFHPTAEEFRPGEVNGSLHVSLGSGVQPIPIVVPFPPKAGSSGPCRDSSSLAMSHLRSRIGDPTSPSASAALSLTGQFTTESSYSRTLYVQVPLGVRDVTSVNEFIDEVIPSELTNKVDTTDFAFHGFFIVSFYDVRDSVIASERCKILLPSAFMTFLKAAGKAARHPLFDLPDTVDGPGDESSKFEGELVVSVSLLDTAIQQCSVDALELFAKEVVSSFGIKATRRLRTTSRGITMRVELFDIRPTQRKVFELHNKHFGRFYVTICPYLTWLRDPESNGHVTHVQDSPNAYAFTSQFQQLQPGSPVYSPQSALDFPLHSPFGSAKHNLQVHSYASSHNQVNLDRIRAGLDVRTTIMLRNIPNKVTHAMLKAIIDRTSLGEYDFMYLRIDFANNCNVGYAFINFSDPIYIVAFAAARAGKRWNTFNSDKVAEISYATIQGKDCLVSKFRNSSVMLEQPDYRPKLYRTGRGPDAGQEEEFPKPDNYMKMRRSCENAAHVGLYAPRLGQHFRSEQRYRRSQYDRGTIAAQAEAAATGFREVCCTCGRYHFDNTCAAALNYRRFT